MATEVESKKVRKFNEVAMWRLGAWSLVMFAAGAYAMSVYSAHISADKQAAVHAAVSAATTEAPGKK